MPDSMTNKEGLNIILALEPWFTIPSCGSTWILVKAIRSLEERLTELEHQLKEKEGCMS